LEQGKLSIYCKNSNLFSTVIFFRKKGKKAGYGLAEFGNPKKNFVFPNIVTARRNYMDNTA
jgi:hypothetical protein